MTATIRYFAGAKQAAGTAQESLPMSEPIALSRLLTQLNADGRRPQLPGVLARCSFLIDGVAVTDPHRIVSPGETVDVLPPFAGG